MTCHQAQGELSFYLYGELDFAREEELEQHLSECAFCQQALAREKTWHTTLNSERPDVPLELLAECRRELKGNVVRLKAADAHRIPMWRRWLTFFEGSFSVWSARAALGSFLVVLGFGAGRWVNRNGVPGFGQPDSSSEMSLFSPETHIRSVRPGDTGEVRIIIDQVRQGEVTGRLDDDRIRQLLLTATRHSSDPAVRVDSVEVLNGQTGNDVRDALLFSVRHDPNAAVRLKALEALRQFSTEAPTREVLGDVLKHDDNAGVRSEAIDVLAPATPLAGMSPELVNTLQDVMRSEQTDDYVRMRCLQVLREVNAPTDSY
jgi:hypothetical protein